jgi:hypothetical protein
MLEYRKNTRHGAPKKEEAGQAAAPDEAVKRERRPDIGRLLLRVSDVALRSLVETPLLHGRRIYSEAVSLRKEVQAALVRAAHRRP